MSDRRVIRWRIALRSAPPAVYAMLASDEGRARFWAESAPRSGDEIAFEFPDGTRTTGRVLGEDAPRLFTLDYFGSRTTFELEPDASGGTVVTLRAEDVDAGEREEVAAGWVSVLLALKAAVDHGVDLRNHDRQRSWGGGFVDN